VNVYKLLCAIVLALALVVSAAHGRSLDDSLKLLDPEERAHQACIIKGIDEFRRTKRLPGVDRLKTSIFKRALFDGKSVIAKGAAVRASGHWYALTFTCGVTDDQMRATSFTFELGREIPEAEWEDHGLWK
jgi:hypothetical protein